MRQRRQRLAHRVPQAHPAVLAHGDEALPLSDSPQQLSQRDRGLLDVQRTREVEPVPLAPRLHRQRLEPRGRGHADPAAIRPLDPHGVHIQRRGPRHQLQRRVQVRDLPRKRRQLDRSVVPVQAQGPPQHLGRAHLGRQLAPAMDGALVAKSQQLVGPAPGRQRRALGQGLRGQAHQQGAVRLQLQPQHQPRPAGHLLAAQLATEAQGGERGEAREARDQRRHGLCGHPGGVTAQPQHQIRQRGGELADRETPGLDVRIQEEPVAGPLPKQLRGLSHRQAPPPELERQVDAPALVHLHRERRLAPLEPHREQRPPSALAQEDARVPGQLAQRTQRGRPRRVTVKRVRRVSQQRRGRLVRARLFAARVARDVVGADGLAAPALLVLEWSHQGGLDLQHGLQLHAPAQLAAVEDLVGLRRRQHAVQALDDALPRRLSHGAAPRDRLVVLAARREHL